MKHALYARTFDPLTNGHLWVMQKGVKLFDQLTMAVAVNPTKKPMFSAEDRRDMLFDVALQLSDACRVIIIEDRYTVDVAAELGAQYLLRGIRNGIDAEYELGISELNAGINPDIETIYVAPPPELRNVSSSVVRGFIGPQGWEEQVSSRVPSSVYERIVEKVKK